MASDELKLVVAEPETAALFTYLEGESRDADLRLVASWLLHTELNCVARRRSKAVDVENVRRALELVTLIDVERVDALAAGSSPYRLRASDGIHLAIALRAGADAMITYDAELQEAARAAGLAVVAPA